MLNMSKKSVVSEYLNLAGNTVFVIGGSSGIGRGVADALAQANARVVVLSRTPTDIESNSSLLWRQIDLSKPKQSRRQLTKVLAEFGEQLNAVFYSAIYYGSKRTNFLEVSEVEWKQQINVNLHGLWLSLSLTMPYLQRRLSGLFVHFSSEVVYNAGPERSGYAATKAAAFNLIRSLAQEDPSGRVRLVQLLPTNMVDTAGIRQRRPSDFDYSNYMTPQHFAKAALHLVQTMGQGMHGESLVVDNDGSFQTISESPPMSQSNRGKL